MPEPSTASLAGMQGVVHGGQQAVIGSHVYVYAVGTSGLRNASVSLLTSVIGKTAQDTSGNYYVTSGADGAFSLTGNYSCSAGQQVYLLAVGGDSGSGNNDALNMMAPLGACPSGGSFATSVPFVTINEVTTVAAGYALAGMSGGAAYFSVNNTTAGKAAAANAMALALQMVDISTGTARTTTPNGNGVVPQALINTIANILAACVNSIGSSSTACSTLGNKPVEATTAMAAAPYRNVSTLFGLSSTTPPFAPALSTAPSSFALRIDWFTGTQLTSDGTTAYQNSALNRSLAIDTNGNAWVVGKYLHRITPTGDLSTFKTVSFVAPGNLVVDPASFEVWVAETAGRYSTSYTNKLYGFNFSGTNYGAVGFGPYTAACGTTDCASFAADGNGYLWTPDSTNSRLSRIDPLGNVTHYATTITPKVITFSNDGYLWLTDGQQVGFYIMTNSVPDAGHLQDNRSSANITAMAGSWLLDGGNTPGNRSGSITMMDSISGSYYAFYYLLGYGFQTYSSGLTNAYAMANEPSSYRSYISTLTGSQLNLFDFGSSQGTYNPLDTYSSNSTVGAPAIDAGGNVWMVENNGNSVAEFVGLARPVHVPMTPGYLADAP